MSISHPPTLIPSDPQERATWIVRRLAEQGSSLAAVAHSLDVRRQAVSNTLMYPASARIDEALAKALGLPAPTLFPERYDAEGKRIDRRPSTSGFATHRKITRTAPACNDQRKVS